MARLGWTFSPEQRQRLRDADTKWKSKAWLRSACTLFAFLAMCLFAAAVAQTLDWVRDEGLSGGSDWQDGMCLAPVLLSLILSPLLFYLSLSRPVKGTKKPLHPIIPLIIDTIIWALCIPSLVFSVGTGWFWYWQPVIVQINGLIPCRGVNAFSKPCQPAIYRMGGIEIAADIFLCFLTILHLTLSILSLISLIRLRRRSRLAHTHPNLDPKAGAQRNIELQYHRSPEEHAQNSPSGVPPAYVSGVPPGSAAGFYHGGEGKAAAGSGRTSDGSLDGGNARFEKDLEAGGARNPFADEHERKEEESVGENIESAVKYM